MLERSFEAFPISRKIAVDISIVLSRRKSLIIPKITENNVTNPQMFKVPTDAFFTERAKSKFEIYEK